MQVDSRFPVAEVAVAVCNAQPELVPIILGMLHEVTLSSLLSTLSRAWQSAMRGILRVRTPHAPHADRRYARWRSRSALCG